MLAWPSVGGTEIATLRLIQTVPRGAFGHVAVCASPVSDTHRLFSGAGIDVVPYRPCELSLRRPLPFLRASLGVARTLRATGASLVHCTDVIAAFQTVLGARIARLPVICHVRNPHDDIPLGYRQLLRGVTRFVFVSQHARDRFPLRLAETRGLVLYDGVEAEEVPHPAARAAVVAEFAIPPSAKIVGMVARIAPQKDHQTFLEAARLVLQSAPETHFLIVGDHSGSAAAELHAELGRRVRDSDIAPHVTFTGFRSDTASLFAAMDVAVLATHFEGFGLVLLEAMIQGRPVVATAVGGVLEIVADGETGLLHRHQDADHLAEQILSLLRDPERARRIAVAGHRFVRERFTTEQLASGMSTLYHSLLG